MASNQPRTSTSSRSNRDDVLQFLDSLDAYSPSSPSSNPPASSSNLPRSTSTTSSLSHSQSHAQSPHSQTTATTPKNAQEAQSVLDFLDEITSKTTSPPPPHTSTSRTSIDQSRRVPTSNNSTTGGGMRTTGSRSNLSQIAGATTASPQQSAARKSTESVRSQRSVTPATGERASPASINRNLPSSSATQAQRQQSSPPPPPPTQSVSVPAQPQAATATAGGWGWSSVWSTASAAVNQASQLAQQARTVAEEQVKANAGGLGEGLMKAWNHEGGEPNGEGGEGGMKKWTDGVQGLVKGANLEGLGKELKSTTLKSLTDLLNAVAPPIAEHEVIEVSLSHDMKGYDGVETLVYRGLSKIMDQIEGGTLMVNRAKDDSNDESSKSGEKATTDSEEEERALNSIEGFEPGWGLCQKTLDRLISTNYKPPVNDSVKGKDSPSSLTLPVTTCPVYLRLQPVLASLPSLAPTSSTSNNVNNNNNKQLYFQVMLIDPTHSLTHHTISQPLPASWLEIPFEENEWVEEFMVDTIRGAVEVIGQEYITGRMRAQGDAIEFAREEARRTIESQQQQHQEGRKGKDGTSEEEKEREVSTMSQEARVGIV